MGTRPTPAIPQKLVPISAQKNSFMRKQVRNLDYVFSPSSIAIVGASKNPKKVGHAILRNLIQAGFSGSLYPVNPSEDSILGLKTFKKISEIKKSVDCAIIATPANTVYEILKDALKANLKAAVVISGGFAEVGNKKEEQKIAALANAHDIALIGPNCMGILCPEFKNDSIFLPTFKLGRPHQGDISFISQSGAVGGCIVDLAAKSSLGISKFVSYGNAACINEADLLQYLQKDENTKAVISYIEGVQDGRKFMQAASSFTSKKPLVVLKAGKSKLGSQAALSHTAALAGSSKIFSAALNQCGAIEAQNLDELFHLAKILQISKFFSPRLCILTNGGGNGVLAADAVEKYGMKLSDFSPQISASLKKCLPSYANVKNPLDIIGDADAHRYESALNLLIENPSTDAIVVIILFQTPNLDSRIVSVLSQARAKTKKPIVAVCTGGEYTQMHAKMLDDYGIPTYPSPEDAISALSKMLKFNVSSHTGG
ncbi:MAG: CoA-binding protein [Candidatus Micrarchaeota archaeon]